MARFSERHGYTSLKDTLQIESMDSRLRVSIWNLVFIHLKPTLEYPARLDNQNKSYQHFFYMLWLRYLHQKINNIPSHTEQLVELIEDYIDSKEWHDVYDFIEFFVEEGFLHYSESKEDFTKSINNVLIRFNSAYRLVNGQITPITDEQEIIEIEEVNQIDNKGVREHISTALSMLSDKDSPDYRNSIKESISAVESFVKVTCQDNKGTLGALLKNFQGHPALNTAFKNLYGWTNDEKGIRHSLLDEGSPVGFDEAKFMLVACSSFINYAKSKLATNKVE